MVGDPVSEGTPESAFAPIALAPGTLDAGLAMMLAELIRQNLAQNPRKWGDFNKLDRLISIEARDAEVTVTLEFTRGALVVHNGIYGFPPLRISADAVPVLELSTIRIVRGIPDLLNPVGRSLLKKFLTGAVRITGMVGNLVPLIRLTRLMSVND